MGDTARKRFAMFATNFENQLNQTRQNFQKMNRGEHGSSDSSAGMGGGAGMSAAERRGLLDEGDDEEDMIEFEVRKNQ